MIEITTNKGVIVIDSRYIVYVERIDKSSIYIGLSSRRDIEITISEIPTAKVENKDRDGEEASDWIRIIREFLNTPVL